MSEHLTLLDIIDRSTEYLNKKGVPNSKCDVEWIISHVTQKGKLELYLDFGNFLVKEDLNKIRKCIVDRGKRIPLQHILGKVNFAGYELKCDKRALIPRPETEYFTELIKERITTEYNGKILDFGTGSGAIIITLCLEIKNCDGFGMDKSIVRVRNRKLSDLLNKLTKGIGFSDWKTKWEYYDLRISISAPKHLQDLAEWIERGFYNEGRQEELVEQIKSIDPNANIILGSIDRLKKQLKKLENKTK